MSEAGKTGKTEDTEPSLYSNHLTDEVLKQAPSATRERWSDGDATYEGYRVSGRDAVMVISADIAENLQDAEDLAASPDPEDRQDAARLRQECILMLGGLLKQVESAPLGRLDLISCKTGTSVMAE